MRTPAHGFFNEGYDKYEGILENFFEMLRINLYINVHTLKHYWFQNVPNGKLGGI